MGRLTVAAAMGSLLILGWASERDRLAMASLVCLCRLLGLRQLKSLFWVTLMFYFLAPPFTGVVISQPPRIQSSLLDGPALKYLSLVSRIALAYLVFLALKKITSGWKLVWLHGVMLGLILACGALTEFNPEAAGFAMSLLMHFSWVFYLLCYLVLETPTLSLSQFTVFNLVPFWEVSSVPRPVIHIEPRTENEDLLARRCIRVALSVSLLIVAGGLTDAFLYNRNFHGLALPWSIQALPDLGNTGLSPSLLLVYPRWKIILSIVWTSLHRITNYFSMFVFIECSYLLLSYELPTRFTFPLRATSFGEFYNALMPYYIMLINRIYLYPLYSVLRKRGWNRFRAYDTALCFAVVVGGLMTHIVRDLHVVAFVGGGEYLLRYLVHGTPYFVLLFFAVRWVKIPVLLTRFLPYPVTFTILLTLYSILFMTRMDGMFVTWEERWLFSKALFFGL